MTLVFKFLLYKPEITTSKREFVSTFGQQILWLFISVVSATKEVTKPWTLCMHTLALVSRICISAHLHIPRSWAMISPTEDLCHVPEYIDGGQQVPTVAGPILGDFHKVLEHFWQPVSHQATLSFGKVLPSLRNGKKHDKHFRNSQVNESTEGIAGGRFLIFLVVRRAD